MLSVKIEKDSLANLEFILLQAFFITFGILSHLFPNPFSKPCPSDLI